MSSTVPRKHTVDAATAAGSSRAPVQWGGVTVGTVRLVREPPHVSRVMASQLQRV